MKILYFAICTIIFSTLVSDGNCGVINDVFGNVKDKTTAIKDSVSSWLSYGKELLIGSKGRPITQGKNLEEVDEGIFSAIYNRLISGLLSTRDNVYSLFAFDDEEGNTEIISTVRDGVNDRIAVITSIDSDKPILSDLTEIRRAVNTMINKQKQIQEASGIEPVEISVEEARANFNKRVDDAKESTVEIAPSAQTDSIPSEKGLINKAVSEAEEFTSTLEHLEQSGIELSEKEREVLNAISNRIRDKANSVYISENAPVDQEKPSDVAEEKKE